MTIQTRGREATRPAPSASSCLLAEAALYPGKEIRLLALHVMLEEQAQGLEPRLKGGVADARREDASELRAEHEVLVDLHAEGSSGSRVEDGLLPGQMSDQVFGQPRRGSSAGVTARLDGELLEERVEFTMLGDEDTNGVHRWSSFFYAIVSFLRSPRAVFLYCFLYCGAGAMVISTRLEQSAPPWHSADP